MRYIFSNHCHVPYIFSGTLGKTLQAFSLYTNGSKLLSTNRPAGNLGCLNGIRFLSMSWVILGHSYAFGLYQASKSSSPIPVHKVHVEKNHGKFHLREV